MMDAREFKVKVMPASSKIFRLALKLTKHRHDAEDIVQEIFLKLWRNRDQIGSVNNLDAYIFSMTRNLCLDRIKAKKPHYYDDRQGDAVGFERSGPEPDPAKKLELNDTVEKIRDIMEGLPETQRTIIHLRDIEGMDYEAIAEIMDMEINAVRVSLSRARMRVRELIIKLDQI